MLLIPASAATGAYVWNFTPSIPVGLYRIEQKSWERGDIVAVKPTEAFGEQLSRAGVLKSGRLLLKRVAAVAGDVVCRSGVIVSINGEYAVTARMIGAGGQQLPAWSGCVRLSAHQVFLLGDTEGSFDGRYFGAVDSAPIVGRLSRMLVWKYPGV